MSHRSPFVEEREVRPESPELRWPPSSGQELESSIYIFPNPSSNPPSPNSLSEFSVPTQFTTSGLSSPTNELPDTQTSSIREWNDRALSSLSLNTSPASGRMLEIETGFEVEDISNWNELLGITRGTPLSRMPPGGEPVVEEPTDKAVGLIQRRAMILRLYSDDYYVSARRFDSRTTSTNIFPTRPRVRFPLLSFFLAFLSIDDSTIELLEHPTSPYSALFFEHALHKDVQEETEYLRRVSLSEGKIDTLREGLKVVCSPAYAPSSPFLASHLHLRGIWSLVTEVVNNSGKAIREVLQAKST